MEMFSTKTSVCPTSRGLKKEPKNMFITLNLLTHEHWSQDIPCKLETDQHMVVVQ